MDFLLLMDRYFLGKILIACIVGMSGISIACGYYQKSFLGHFLQFLQFVRWLLKLTFLFALLLFLSLLLFGEKGFPYPFFGVGAVISIIFFISNSSLLPLKIIISISLIVMIPFQLLGLLVCPHGPFPGLISGLIVGVCIGILSRSSKYIEGLFEGMGSGMRKNKELQIVNNCRMIEFKANLIQWQVEGYSELKGVMEIKNSDQMERKFNEVKQKIERLKAVESTLNRLFQDVPEEQAVFESEMESIRKKQKDLSKVDEAEREIKNLSNTLTEHCRLKNEILDSIAEVTQK